MSTHREAVEAAVSAAQGVLKTTDKPLIELARALADQVDASGADGPGTRLAGTYLTTLRTLHSRIGGSLEAGPATKLSKLRSVAGGKP